MFDAFRPDEADGGKPEAGSGQRDSGVVKKSHRHKAEDQRIIGPKPVVLVQHQEQEDQRPNPIFFHRNTRHPSNRLGQNGHTVGSQRFFAQGGTFAADSQSRQKKVRSLYEGPDRIGHFFR